jgi:hypothetical protein
MTLSELRRIAAGRPKVTWYKTNAEEYALDCEFLNMCEAHIDRLLDVVEAAKFVANHGVSQLEGLDRLREDLAALEVE